jgi:hypothetical protein
MGQEILYCSKCQTQLRSADFDKQKAYRLHQSVYCLKCARDSVHALPPETIQQLIAQIAQQEGTAEKKNSSTSRILRVAEIRPGKSVPHRGAAGPLSPGPAGWITVGLLAAAALLVAVFASGSQEPKSPPRAAPSPVAAQTAPPPERRPGPEAPAPPPSLPAPPPESAGTFTAEATESIRRAREFARMNPGDLVGQIALFEKAAWDSSGTPLQDAAQRDLENLKSKDRTLAVKELPGLLDPVRSAAAREEFGQAMTLLNQGRKLHAVSEWTGPVEKALKELRGQVDGIYGPLKEKAVAAARNGNAGELNAIRERLAKWNLEEFRADLEREISQASAVAKPEVPPTPPKPAPPGPTLLPQKTSEAGLDPGLVGRWTFDEGKGALASDSSRNRNHATLVGGPVWTEGKMGGAVGLNGGDAHVLVPAAPALADLGPLTVSAWVKPVKLKLGRVVAKEGVERGRWMLIAGEGAIAFAKDFSAQELRRETVANLLPCGAWHHLAVTWDGTAQVTQVHIYVDGIEAAYVKNQDGAGKKMSDASTPLIIGNRGDFNRGFQGTIDDVRLYARVLTARELASLSSPSAK